MNIPKYPGYLIRGPSNWIIQSLTDLIFGGNKFQSISDRKCFHDGVTSDDGNEFQKTDKVFLVVLLNKLH